MKTLLSFGLLIVSFFGQAQTIALQSFATGFSEPLEIAHAGDSRLFVVQKGGLIRIVNANGSVNATPFLNISSLVSTVSERGLLGLAFHPNYATNGYFFINYSNTSGDTVIARYSVNSGNPGVANTTGTILMTITQPYSNHNGGSIKFGPDGYLYIGMGDGGSGGDPGNRAQNINENLGKMLRIDVNSTIAPYYTNPATNPYVGVAGNDEIWAIGLRNPWKFSFNRLNGDLWIADVGQGSVEEINKVINPLTAGLNFGWRCYEGNSTYNSTGCAPASTMTFPFTQYARSGGACSVTGGYFYTGSMYPNFQNKYFFTDYCDDKIRMVNSSGVITTTTSFSGNNFVTFGEDVNGELYIAGISSGTIYKVIDTSLSSSDFENNGFTLFPNPAKEMFTIKSSTANLATKAAIFDITGKLLFTKELSNNSEHTIETTSLAKGIYLVSVETSNGTNYSTKLIVE
ncbi:MAG: PQQ-dependent sugar dehydrogenase [Flavobacterium sp.]|jgi:glucose/arabinose dehydrogenase|uniref:PQQ-dependent sugar dehydrogenase n=1 Tax=Flavobacterium sp. TaxID=239 RepID=UPI002B4677AF|nr:PQQ-dependent sugar dehydrogenase [Flavobacterium sp.]WRH72250.1 MAG: PQQ-dependent sugar dehydrogenase [Flavobacterium sp.]